MAYNNVVYLYLLFGVGMHYLDITKGSWMIKDNILGEKCCLEFHTLIITLFTFANRQEGQVHACMVW